MHMLKKMNISEKLCLLRVKKGLSYGRLGQLAHIAPSTYLQWEQGVIPSRLKLAPVLELFSDLYETEIAQKQLRDDTLRLAFDKKGKVIFEPDQEENSLAGSDRGHSDIGARAETLLEYEGLYSRLRLSGQLTEREAQMLLYLLKGFVSERDVGGKG